MLLSLAVVKFDNMLYFDPVEEELEMKGNEGTRN